MAEDDSLRLYPGINRGHTHDLREIHRLFHGYYLSIGSMGIGILAKMKNMES
jgi:hypothetical protein